VQKRGCGMSQITKGNGHPGVAGGLGLLAQRESEPRSWAEVALVDAPVAVAAFDAGLRCQYANASYRRLLDRTSSPVGVPFADLHPLLAAGQMRQVAGVLDTLEPCSIDAPSPHSRTWQLRLRPVSGPHAEGGLALTALDVTDERQQAELQALPLQDPLTGLANRRQFDDELTRALARSRRRSTSVALVVADLEGLDAINDGQGHAAGDAVLVTMAARLQAACRAGDSVARIDENELAVMGEDFTTLRDASLLAARVRTVLSEPVDVDHSTVVLSASVGVAFADPQEGLAALYERAGRAKHDPGTAEQAASDIGLSGISRR